MPLNPMGAAKLGERRGDPQLGKEQVDRHQLRERHEGSWDKIGCSSIRETQTS